MLEDPLEKYEDCEQVYLRKSLFAESCLSKEETKENNILCFLS
jgi:hypothetical protein